MDWKTVVGHSSQLAQLDALLKQDLTSGAFLFYGPSGVGKTHVAKEFSRKILCMAKGVKLCDCQSCLMFEQKVNPDFFFVDMADTPIQELRDLIAKMSMSAINKTKVIILAHADKCPENNLNLLLKSIETAFQSVFILTASRKSVLPGPLVSRCTAISLSSLSNSEIKQVADMNHVPVENLELLVSLCAGSAKTLLEIDSLILQKLGELSNTASVALRQKDIAGILKFSSACGNESMLKYFMINLQHSIHLALKEKCGVISDKTSLSSLLAFLRKDVLIEVDALLDSTALYFKSGNVDYLCTSALLRLAYA